MNTTTKAISIVFGAILLTGSAAHAQTADDMTCYKVKGNKSFTTATVDVEALDPALGVNSSCRLKRKPHKVCVPSDAEVTETDSEQRVVAGDELTNYYICYKLKCVDSGLSEMQAVDQFGDHALSRARTSEICVPASVGCGGNVQPGEMSGMLETHNEVRASVPGTDDPPAPLQWDSCLEAGAAAHARNCHWGHASSSERGGAGENLFAISRPGYYLPEQIASGWAAESRNYDYASGTCAENKVCGHYTQMVWRDTHKLGCAVQVCETGNPFGTSGPWEYWVCRYDPAGNHRGELPY